MQTFITFSVYIKWRTVMGLTKVFNFYIPAAQSPKR